VLLVGKKNLLKQKAIFFYPAIKYLPASGALATRLALHLS